MPGGPQFDELAEVGGTTSFSVADEFGNVISVTPTHGGGFGTGVVVGRTGLLFNNGTRIGSTSPYPDDVNYVRGGQIPLLNNSPVIVMKDGEFVLAIGSPGGETIGQTQFQTVLNVLEFGMSIQVGSCGPTVRPYRRAELLLARCRDCAEPREPYRSGSRQRVDGHRAQGGAGCTLQLRQQPRDPSGCQNWNAVGWRGSQTGRIRGRLVTGPPSEASCPRSWWAG